MMHQRISKKIILYLFFFFILVTVNNTNFNNDFYLIKKLKIEGLSNEETTQLNNELMIFRNMNIFLFDGMNISKKIYSNGRVESLSVFKNYPTTLNIKIKKTKFLAVTKKNNIDYFVGNNGNLIRAKIINQDLPYIFGNIDVNNFLQFKKIIDESNFEFNEIKNLYYFKSKRWDVVTKNGFTFKMPLNLTVDKLNLLNEIINKNEFNNSKIIDFRQNNVLVING